MKVETKVGLLFGSAAVLVVAFAWLIGAVNPFSRTYNINIQYNFAGGIEVGSPVRVMGIKVGKVESIDFVPDQKDGQGQEVKLRIKISVEKKAKETVRKDSHFFINLAGIIGEKFLEITPGSLSEPALEPNATVRGEDPPRIDQMISQGYGLAGKLLDLVSKNEGSVTHTIELLDRLVTNFNGALGQLDKTTKNVEVHRLLKNMVEISDDVHDMTRRVRTPEGQATIELMYRLLWRLEPLDKESLRQFLQKEGIRAKIF